MRLFYIVCTIIIGLILLIVSFAQFGGSCTWYLIGTTSNPSLVLLVTSFLGAAMGAFFMMFIISKKEVDPEAEIDNEEGGIGE